MNSEKYAPEPTLVTAGAKSAETKVAGLFSELKNYNTNSVLVQGKSSVGRRFLDNSRHPDLALRIASLGTVCGAPATVMTTANWPLG